MASKYKQSPVDAATGHISIMQNDFLCNQEHLEQS